MGVRLKAVCSECMTMHFADLDFGQEDIRCPACGHAMKSLPEGELNEIDLAQRKQRTNNIIALVGFTIAVICFFVWIFNQDPGMYHFGDPRPPLEVQESSTYTVVLPGLFIVGLLVTLIFAVLGALRRYIIEF